MSFGQLLLTSLAPILEIVIFCCFGVLFTRTKVITNAGKNVLGNLTKELFLPSLLFTKLVKSVNADLLSVFWVVSLSVFVFGSIAGLLGLGYSALCKQMPSRKKRVIVACCAISNTGNVPLVFVVAACNQTVGPFSEIENCSNRAVGLVIFGMLVGVIAQWTFGSWLLSERSAVASTPSESDESCLIEAVPKERESWSFTKLIKKYFNPPIFSVFVGIIVGNIQPVKDYLIDPSNLLHSLFRVLEMFGESFIPSMMLILGSNLSSGPSSIEPSVLFGVSVIRLLILPPLSGMAIFSLRSAGLIPADPLLAFVAIMMGSAPTAIILNTIATLQGFEQQTIATILFYQYLFSAVTMCFWLSLDLHLLFDS